MPRLTKKARDELKARGEWKSVSVTTQKFDGALEFCRLAAEANKDPVPNLPKGWHVQEPRGPVFTPDCEVIGEAADKFLSSGDFYEYVDEAYSPAKDEDVTPDGCFFDAMMLCAANRMISTSGLSEASETWGIPDLTIPREYAGWFQYLGAFDQDDVHARLIDPMSMAKSFMWAATFCGDAHKARAAVDRLWLPTGQSDNHTRLSVAIGLKDGLFKEEHDVGIDGLLVSLFSGVIPIEVRNAIDRLPAVHRENVPLLFRMYKDGPHFHKFIGSKAFSATLKEIGLKWEDPSTAHLCMHKSFRDLCKEAERRWEKRGFDNPLNPTFGDINRSAPFGSRLQLVRFSGEGECFFQGSDISAEEIVEAKSFRTSSLVYGGVPSLATFRFNPDVPLSSFEEVPRALDLINQGNSDDEMIVV